ncbi:hypothetical protein ATO6_06985 [Oceanicola sp. 22II-s10i]|uniref:hypothetical protein n=1 Tax=Oceanicola sp. 22II-s10i TaxID=1317116 RepID=UPI000B5282D4|nr:hypothetical protein [Oceanicola sp. 22II-s10i]OWU86530.1 hypothetical protein ATO6_06985 [Oceanicola sp. 22II-s10i]
MPEDGISFLFRKTADTDKTDDGFSFDTGRFSVGTYYDAYKTGDSQDTKTDFAAPEWEDNVPPDMTDEFSFLL